MKLLLSLLLLVAGVSSLQTDFLKNWNLEQHSHSHHRSGSSCQNGGTFISLRHNRGFCLCPKGFSGIQCETSLLVQCFSGDGRDYRGTVAKSESGQRCLRWSSVKTTYGLGPVVRNGGRNYCRNPDQSASPWCWVQSGRQITRKSCKIPRCEVGLMPEPCGERPQKLYKIVGGKITTVESHPWMASIFQKDRRSQKSIFQCGGTLIAPCWILSAAHCFPDGAATAVGRLSVTLGKNMLNETDNNREQTFNVDKVIVHKGFDNRNGSYNNDIALLQLKGTAGQCAKRTDSVHTACLAPKHQMLPPGVSCDVVGYGKENDRLWYKSQYLREAKVELLSQSVCTDKDYYGSLVTNNMFCAGSPDWSKDACKGDSGGPLLCEVNGRMFLFGIVSWGEGCSRKLRPGVYTRVTNYNRWIEENTGLSSITAGSMYPPK
ncbi:hypothetical protein SKAU_G00181640 [Synaphobranchus kaupii]|uniref:Urokinase-type plasminogen activator n=1 Tax=Synaphobranchus kaupii TaxID=118154 RepID=A0A9Q1FMF0_SYNKA|nr:hypothetical protein SKAU_G00181640 [Synaphobranchus kaupii]